MINIMQNEFYYPALQETEKEGLESSQHSVLRENIKYKTKQL